MSRSAWATALFDLDGTVANTIPLIVASYTHATKLVLGEAASTIESRQWIGRTLVDTFGERYPGRADELMRAYTSWNLANMDRLVERYEGMPDLVEDLAAAGIRTGVVTSKRRAAAERTLRAVGLAASLSVICAMEDTQRHKPEPDPLLRAFEVLGVEPADTCYVGDAVVDLQAAQGAGCAGIGVTWGAGERADLLAVPSVGVVDSVADLRALLGVSSS